MNIHPLLPFSNSKTLHSQLTCNLKFVFEAITQVTHFLICIFRKIAKLQVQTGLILRTYVKMLLILYKIQQNLYNIMVLYHQYTQEEKEKKKRQATFTSYRLSVQVIPSSNVYYSGVMMGHKNAFAETIRDCRLPKDGKQ